MTCVYCTKIFKVDEGQETCQSCAMFGGCKKVRCPYCGYDMPGTENKSTMTKSFGQFIKGFMKL